MKTRLVNVAREKCDIYIGRGSPFGNPFKIGKDGTREEVIMAYSAYFDLRLNREPDFLKRVEALRGKVLG